MAATPTALDGTHAHAGSPHPPGRIGPNAIIRLAESIEAFESAASARRIFHAAGLDHYVDRPPAGMVDEFDVVTLHRILGAELGQRRAKSISWIAGRRTADYLLANRIPLAAQRVLKSLPPIAASRMLLSAIARHSWTFAGTGSYAARPGNPTVIRIANCPICRGAITRLPVCDFYSATFERLFAVLVSPDASVVETSCSASGADACTFEISW